MPTSLIARARRSAIVLATVAVLLVGLVPAVAAAGPLDVTTPYPSIAVAPGSDASFDLTITSITDGTVDLTVTGAPTGWKATLNGGGFVITGVTAVAGKPATARLDVQVPADATATTANLAVKATLGAQTKTLPIRVEVDAAAAGDITLTTTSPTLTGSSESDFSFTLTLQNDTAQDQTVSAAATGPTGWRIDTKLSAAQAASTVVTAGSSTTITVTATPPPNAPAGPSEINVTATAGSKTIEGKLGVVITGSFSMTLATPNQLVSANGSAGSGTSQQLVIKNTGTGPLTNVAMTATQPTNWTVTFDQETIPAIPPDQEVTVTATITPTGEAVTGDYQVTIRAAAAGEGGASAADASLPMTFTVETSPIWLLAGFALIVAILAALFYVFRTYGRR